ncbi:Agmatine deiminase [Anatilimnocola aggregata]|uniref:Agmatine deiminase n=1 Tax=Anatilimnocola aggregata TaxID=2528021 RepID=A0A517YKK5_9BACT|nr:agmatine deiminase family protein [Anatilimnocola aggregata]QDU30759.1 Agmatine deiminase [Anatilimnocola aggregata]
MPAETAPAQTPASLGYRWPAEWERQASVWLSWPRNPATWPDKFEPVPAEFAQFVRTIARYEPVNILAGGSEILAQAKSLVGDLPNVTIHDIATNDAWCRDHGPIFLSGPKGTQPALVDWEYNAWGGKYPPFDKDNLVPKIIGKLQGRKVFTPGIILEGGAIEGNGEGLLITTESCLLNPNRNPHLSREQVERYLADYLAIKKVLWLTGGEMAGDDTDGHIDQIARFINPRTIVVCVCDDPTDDNYGPTQQNLVELQNLTDLEGRPFEVVRLPLPKPLFVDDQRLPAGYGNFLIVNDAVIVPQFGDPADATAIGILQDLMPKHQVVGSPSLDLVWGLGSFHCLSQQEPLAHL